MRNDQLVLYVPFQHYVFGPYDVEQLYCHKDCDCYVDAADYHPILLNRFGCDDSGQDKQDDQTDSIPYKKLE